MFHVLFMLCCCVIHPTEGIEYCIVHPYISYPAAAAFVLTALPGVRRVAYRLTLGRLRNPEVIHSLLILESLFDTRELREGDSLGFRGE